MNDSRFNKKILNFTVRDYLTHTGRNQLKDSWDNKFIQWIISNMLILENLLLLTK